MSKKVSANPCERVFDDFVREYGGELTDEVLPSGKNKPKNADYLLEGRTVIAELKCLQKEYFNDPPLAKKAENLLNVWLKQGKIPRSHMNGNKITIPEELAPKVVQLFRPPIKAALEKANQQIKNTKNALGIFKAKGLLILVNEQNSALTPNVLFYILADLLKSRYRQIESFIYTVPTMLMKVEGVADATTLWVSGDARSGSRGVDPEILSAIEKQWSAFLEKSFKFKAQRIELDDLGALRNMGFFRE